MGNVLQLFSKGGLIPEGPPAAVPFAAHRWQSCFREKLALLGGWMSAEGRDVYSPLNLISQLMLQRTDCFQLWSSSRGMFKTEVMCGCVKSPTVGVKSLVRSIEKADLFELPRSG